MAQVSEPADDVCQPTDGVCRPTVSAPPYYILLKHSGRGEGGVRPAGVCGAGRCLRSRSMSAECGVRIVRSADCRLRGRTISAERGPRSTADSCGLRSFVIELGRQLYLGRQRWEWLRFPTRPTRSAAAHRDGVRNVERSKRFINRSCNRLAASNYPPTRILERSVGILILQCTYLNTDNPFHKIPTLFAPILSCLHFPYFPLLPV